MSARSSRRRTGRRGAAAATPSPAPTKRTRGGSDAASGAAGGGPEGVGTRTRGACGFAGRALGGSGSRACGAYFGSIAVVHTPCCWRAWRRFYVFFCQMGGAMPCPHLVLTPCGALCHATCVAARPKRKVAADPTPQKLKVRASALCPCIRGVVALHMSMRLQHARDQLTRCRAACSAAAQTRAGVRKHGQPATGGRRYQAASYGAVGRFIEVRANAVHHARCVLGASLAHPHLLVPTQAAEPASR